MAWFIRRRGPPIGALAMLGLVAAVSYAQAVPDRIASVDVDGTVFRVELFSGKVLLGPDLVGATLSLSQPGGITQAIKIESVKIDPTDPDHETLLYHFLAVNTDTGQSSEVCELNPDGERWGFPVRGQWDAEGRHISDSGYTLTCSDGAQGKCVRFGYKPWKTLANGMHLEPYHQACIRLVRADYCGGHGTTRNGMLIDIYDTIGINAPDPKASAAGVRFEAAWSPAGALCVAHTRVPENVTLDELARDCPRLLGHLGPTACRAGQPNDSRQPALLYNGSR
jgi:hypothetical protein